MHFCCSGDVSLHELAIKRRDKSSMIRSSATFMVVNRGVAALQTVALCWSSMKKNPPRVALPSFCSLFTALAPFQQEFTEMFRHGQQNPKPKKLQLQEVDTGQRQFRTDKSACGSSRFCTYGNNSLLDISADALLSMCDSFFISIQTLPIPVSVQAKSLLPQMTQKSSYETK